MVQSHNREVAMRTNVVVALAALTTLLALPSESSAQRRPIPRGRGTPGAQPAPLPPEMPAVSRALAYRRSRWSVEGYPFVSQIQVPATTGDAATYTTLGSGSRGDYRFTDHFSMTFDVTSSLPLTTTMTGSVEVGTRFRPLPWSERVRPFADLRAGYAYLSDVYATPSEAFGFTPGSPTAFTEAGRRSRGFGGIAGAGVEYSLTPSIAVTTELTAMRSRMTAYRLSGFTTMPSESRYWMTTVRYQIGLKFNPVTILNLAQNPRL
jgi:hypothetical protein